MPAKFVVKKGTTGKFRFSLVHPNGQVIASSETYSSKASCMQGIKSVQQHAGTAPVEDQTTREWAKAQEELKAKKAASRTRKAAAKKSARSS